MEGKDMFRFGTNFICKIGIKAPKKPKTCLGGEKREKKGGELENTDDEEQCPGLEI